MLIPSALLLATLQAPVPAPAQLAPAPSSIKVVVDPRVELMSILMRLTGAREYRMPQASSDYASRVDEWFGPLRGHDAVKRLVELRRKHGIGYDAPMFLAAHLGPPPEFEPLMPLAPRPMRLDKRWKAEPTQAFLVELRDFARSSECLEFFAEEQAFYLASAERLEGVVASQEILPWLESFFSTQQGAQFQVIVGLLNGGSNYGVGCVFPDGKEHITPVIGANTWDAQGLPRFDQSHVPTILHEFIHSYANRLVDQSWEQLEAPLTKLFKERRELMARQAYNSPRIMMYESLVRACVVRYLASNLGAEAAAAQVARDRKKGFAWVGELAEALARYGAQRERYATLSDFMGEVVSFFEGR